MKTKRLAWLLLLLGAGCTKTVASVGTRLRGPTAIVRFAGITHRKPGEVREYLAIASSRSDEVRFFDPSDDQGVPGPSILAPLSIPTDPYPLFLAAGPLNDALPDALVVASPGPPKLQLISTWEDASGDHSAGNRVVDEIDLAPLLPPGTEILAMVGMGIPYGAPAGDPPVALLRSGQARVFVATTNHKLVVVHFVRAPGKAVAVATPDGAPAGTRAVVQDLSGYDLVDLAAAPDGQHLYGASLDPIVGDDGQAPAYGVAEIDTLAPDPTPSAPLFVRLLGARGPVRSVAAGYVVERDNANPDFFPPGATLEVFAGLDPSGCGIDKPISCGVATLYPSINPRAVSGNLAPDPSGQMPYRSPMPVSGVPLSIRVGMPPEQGVQRSVDKLSGVHLMLLAPGSGQRYTSAVASVASSDGRAYVLDLGRWQPPNDISLLHGDTRAMVTSAISLDQTGQPLASGAGGVGLMQLTPASGQPDDVSVDSAVLPGRVGYTPGFTYNEDWRVAWQGVLPGLYQRHAFVGTLPSGEAYVAFQADTGARDASGNTIWDVQARPGDPAAGVHVGDIVELSYGDVTACGTGSGEDTVAAILPPDPVLYPGGALSLGASPPCAVPGAATANVRASGFVLTGVATGYAGRPEEGKRYDFGWSSVDADPNAPPSEALVLARKARRFYYPSDPSCDFVTSGAHETGCYDDPNLADPLTPGPVVSIRVGLSPGATVVRDMAVGFATQAGIRYMSRSPPVVAATGIYSSLPWASVDVDRSRFAGHADDGLRFYVTYSGDDALMEFGPGGSIGDVVVFR